MHVWSINWSDLTLSCQLAYRTHLAWVQRGFQWLKDCEHSFWPQNKNRPWKRKWGLNRASHCYSKINEKLNPWNEWGSFFYFQSSHKQRCLHSKLGCWRRYLRDSLVCQRLIHESFVRTSPVLEQQLLIQSQILFRSWRSTIWIQRTTVYQMLIRWLFHLNTWFFERWDDRQRRKTRDDQCIWL